MIMLMPPLVVSIFIPAQYGQAVQAAKNGGR